MHFNNTIVDKFIGKTEITYFKLVRSNIIINDEGLWTGRPEDKM